MLNIFQSGSTVERLTRAREFVWSQSPAHEIVVLASTRSAADDFVRELAASREATTGLHRFSLRQLASRIATAELAKRSLTPITATSADAIATLASFDVLRRHELEYFAPVADRPGFAAALASTVRDLRSSGVTPADLTTLGPGGRDLGRLLAEYDQQRRGVALVDSAEIFEIAAQVVENGKADLAGCPLVLIDIAIQSYAERRFISALATKSPQVFATVITDDSRTLAALTVIGGEVAPAPKKFSTSLERLQNYIFEPLPESSYAEDAMVQYFSAPGEGRECIEIARRIHEQARNGVPFDRVAVALRSPQTYSPLLEAALERANVPAYFAHGTSRPDASGRAFLVLLRCAAEGLSAKRFAEYLSLGQVPALGEDGAPLAGRGFWVLPANDETLPESAVVGLESEAAPAAPAAPAERADDTDPMVGGSLRTPWKWEELLVEAAVVGGKERWARRLSGLASELEVRIAGLKKEEPESPRIAGAERELAQLGHLRRFALPIISMLADLPQRTTWGDWLIALEGLAPMVLRSCERVLRVLAELRPMAGVGPVTLEEVCETLSQRLTDLSVEPPKSRFGRVFVGSPEQLRGRSFAVVFVPGLAERVFPQKLHEDPLLLDEFRTRIAAADPPLLTRADRAAEERLRLRIAASAAENCIYFSYPRVEVAMSRPRVPSFYALDVRRTTLGVLPNVDGFEREAVRNGDAELAWFAPKSPNVAIDDIEHDLAVLRPLLVADPKSVRGQGRYLMELSPTLGRSLRTRWKRWQKTWGGFDGLCDGTDSVRTELSRFRLVGRAYSPTSLQNYSACPYKFLLSGIYRLAAREESVQLQMLDPMTRGGIYHAVLARFLRFAREDKYLPLSSVKMARARKEMDSILNEVAAEYHDALAPAIERVWQDEIESMRADLRGWLTHLLEHPDGYVPLHIEYGFGLPPDSDRDEQSTPTPAQLDGGFQIHGVVDVIEKDSASAAILITDHKTGKVRTEEGTVVGGGEFLQPVLYSLSVEAVRKEKVAEARLSYCTSAGGYTERRFPIDAIARRAGLTVLRTIDKAIETAFLPPAPKEDGCKWCDFRAVCGPYEELRSGRKDQAPLALLLELRDMQ